MKNINSVKTFSIFAVLMFCLLLTLPQSIFAQMEQVRTQALAGAAVKTNDIAKANAAIQTMSREFANFSQKAKDSKFTDAISLAGKSGDKESIVSLIKANGISTGTVTVESLEKLTIVIKICYERWCVTITINI